MASKDFQRGKTMTTSLDFNNISTWETIDPETASRRLSSKAPSSSTFNPGALGVVLDLFKRIQDEKARGNVLFNCEKLGLRNWKLYYAFKLYCHGDHDEFVRCVLKSDEAMMKAVKKQEELQQS